MTSFQPSAPLASSLQRSFELGFLGPGEVMFHVEHARAFDQAARALELSTVTRVADLGSGGGLPGLVLAELWPEATFVLIDAMERRCAFLIEAVEACGFGDRVTVVRGRAEELGHDAGLRASFDLVVARSFGPPPVLAECAGPLLREGGLLLVSEPPADELTQQRWPLEGLEQLGFGPVLTPEADFHLAALELRSLTDERFPRRVGIPAKRPLFPIL